MDHQKEFDLLPNTMKESIKIGNYFTSNWSDFLNNRSNDFTIYEIIDISNYLIKFKCITNSKIIECYPEDLWKHNLVHLNDKRLNTLEDYIDEYYRKLDVLKINTRFLKAKKFSEDV